MNRTLSTDVRMLLIVRVVVVTSLLFSALIIQYTAEIVLPINYIYLITALTYVLTIGYIAVAMYFENRELNLFVQISGDVLLETLLVYFTGGADSPFSFLYLVSIITASMLLYRRGGLITASIAAISYGVLVDVMYYRLIPLPPESVFSISVWTSTRMYLNMATNFAGFYATALLTSYLSEKLRETFEELDANRQNLAELRALNENVVESIPSGLLNLSPGGTITFANPMARNILRLGDAGIVGRHVTELGIFDESDWEDLTKSVRETGIVRGEKNHHLGESDMISIGFTMTPLQSIQGAASGLILVFQDLTDFKILEAQLRMKDRMAAVGELSAGIAHEIRNPLAAISGSVQALRKAKDLQPQDQRLLSIILKESDRLNRTIADFLRFVKPKERSPEKFDIAAALIETLELFANSPEVTSRHEIERDIDPPSFSMVGDPNQIRQVFWNLAKNAIQAMPDGGVLRVSSLLEKDRYSIRFIDGGRGISEEDQRNLFQPFRTNRPSGTGLGMAISYRIVQEHRGTMSVNSAIGTGTTITVSLPLEENADAIVVPESMSAMQ